LFGPKAQVEGTLAWRALDLDGTMFANGKKEDAKPKWGLAAAYFKINY
jgi:hypothetical protein